MLSIRISNKCISCYFKAFTDDSGNKFFSLGREKVQCSFGMEFFHVALRKLL